MTFFKLDDILPDIIFEEKINIFDYIKERSKIINPDNYLFPMTHYEHHEKYFYFIKNMCDNKKILIKNPLSNQLISSDIYFLTEHNNIEIRLIANYYFKNENMLLGINLGSGLYVSVLYFINLTTRDFFMFENYVDFEYCFNNDNYFQNIYNIIANTNFEDINNKIGTIKTVYGDYFNITHNLINELTGLYLIEEFGSKNIIDEIILGNYNHYYVDKYFKNKYKNINIVSINDKLTGIICKGVIYKYIHYFLTDDCIKFILSYIKKVAPIEKIYFEKINYIKNKYYPIFSINLRCITNTLIDQDTIISEVINKLKNIYPKSFFLIGGFLGDYNQNYLINSNSCIGCFGIDYLSCLNEYNNVFKLIKDKVNTEDIYSLINLCSNNIIEFSEIITYSIHLNCSYSCIETLLYNVPGTFFGVKYINHYKKFNTVSKNNYRGISYIYEKYRIKFINDDDIESTNISRSYMITSDQIVYEVTRYEINWYKK